MIEAHELRKRYGDVVAVDGVSFIVERGEAFGLLGPNGDGKTTILNMLVGALLPDGGEVVLDGEVDPTRPGRRCVTESGWRLRGWPSTRNSRGTRTCASSGGFTVWPGPS